MIKWFFSSPTPLITILSLIVALCTYKYQRKWNKRQRTKELTEWYAKYTLPKFRYINYIFKQIGFMEIVHKFSKYEDFDSKELSDNINKASSSSITIESLFSNITEDILNQAYSQSGGCEYISKWNENLRYIFSINASMSYEMFKKVVIDLLNEIESKALQLNYCIYDEKMVYPILHQTYLKNLKNLYYFVSTENSQDYDQFYIYTIWLFNLWNRRVDSEKVKLKQTFHKKSKITRI